MRKAQRLSRAKYDDLTNRTFGKLKVIKPIAEPVKAGYHKRWLCQCKCGNTTIVSSDHLKKGEIKSCGCYFHGLSKTRLYRIWNHMNLRCGRKTDDNYKHYGQRGIDVCIEWKDDFLSFYKWAMDNGYSDSLSIDRINNDKGYSPDNCRWVDQKVQANNTRWNHHIEYNGEDHTLSEWGEILGIKPNTLLYRIRRGWDLERAFTTEVKK